MGMGALSEQKIDEILIQLAEERTKKENMSEKDRKVLIDQCPLGMELQFGFGSQGGDNFHETN